MKKMLKDLYLHSLPNDVVVEENSNLAYVHCAITFAAHNESGEKLRQMTNSIENGKGIFNLR
jgi:hypothetical protein